MVLVFLLLSHSQLCIFMFLWLGIISGQLGAKYMVSKNKSKLVLCKTRKLLAVLLHWNPTLVVFHLHNLCQPYWWYLFVVFISIFPVMSYAKHFFMPFTFWTSIASLRGSAHLLLLFWYFFFLEVFCFIYLALYILNIISLSEEWWKNIIFPQSVKCFYSLRIVVIFKNFLVLCSPVCLPFLLFSWPVALKYWRWL